MAVGNIILYVYLVFFFLFYFKTQQGRARQLFGAGIKSVAQLAATDPDNLVKFIKQISYKAARQIVASAKVKNVLFSLARLTWPR